jgi:hypothetical protein
VTRPLAESVYVAGRFFAAGAVPDEDFAALITNPRAWGDPVDNSRSRRTPAAAATSLGPDADTGPEPGSDLFDPSADGVSVDDVNNHLANADDDEIQRVLAAESEGKARKGVLEGPYAPEAKD